MTRIPTDRAATQPAALAAARARLDRLTLYPRPVATRRVRIVCTGWLFHLPWFRRFDGYTMWNLILLRSPALVSDGDLVCHELCHVWQMQHHPVRMPLSYLRLGYAENPYEIEARHAAAATAATAPTSPRAASVDEDLGAPMGDEHEHAAPGPIGRRVDGPDAPAGGSA
ncbi:MAG: hypothetical protein WBQ18_10080 [Solirubrobacteraceae bacterium]